SDSLTCIHEKNCEGDEQSIIDQIKLLNQTLTNLDTLRVASIADNLANAELNNDYVVDGAIPEINSGRINEIEIAYVYSEENIEIITDNYDDILEIASQCPYVGGPAVERARTFIAMVNDTISYDDETVCLISGVYRQINPDSVSTNSLKNKIIVQPNPANNKVNVILQGKFEGLCEIQIRNLLGKNIFNSEMDCKVNS